jgi:very-long-chain enoyl-CoA reductase
MPPRLHNVVSYSVALLVFVGTALGLHLHDPSSAPVAGVPLLAGALWCVHFARRSFESAFVHRYSRKQISAGDFVTEYVYYWGFAYWNAHSLFQSGYQAPALPWLVAGVSLFVLAELGNTWAHLKLRALRRQGTTERQIPRGGLFEWLSCPHYSCEILSWLGFALTVETWAALGFAALGAAILAFWARTRHLAYRQDFPDYPARRRALVPFVF